MSGHHQSSSARNPEPSAPARATRRPGPQDLSHRDAGLAAETEALMRARREFPGHRIWRELTPGRAVFVARSRHPGARPHTAVTPDLSELLAALSDGSLPDAAMNHPEPARENAPTRQRTPPPGGEAR